MSFQPTAFLPDVLRLRNGSLVTDVIGWRTRRAELKELLQQHILGHLPSNDNGLLVPILTSATILNQTASESLLCAAFA